MINFVWVPGFKKSYKKRILSNPALKQKFENAITLFSINPSDELLKTYKLSGELKDYWAFSGYHDIRIVFKYLSEHDVLLIDIGTHDEVF